MGAMNHVMGIKKAFIKLESINLVNIVIMT